MISCWIKRGIFAVLAVAFFTIAYTQFRASGFTANSTLAGAVGILSAVGCVTGKGG